MPKLLIVDDEVDVREFAANFFKKRNIDVTTASSGKEALTLIDQQKPDLVLLDIRMGEVTGVDVLKHLRSKNNNTKIMMVTGVENGDMINETQQLGITSYIHKPLILEELEKVVLKELKKT